MESPAVNCKELLPHTFSSQTVVFSRCSGVVLDSLQYESGVPNEFPDQFHKDRGHEAKDPVPDVVRAPEEVEDQAEDEETEGVRVEHVLRTAGPVPLLHVERPPGSFMPGHVVSAVRDEGKRVN